MPLPEQFVDRLRRIVPANRVESVLASFEAPARAAFRVCVLLAPEDEVIAALKDENVPVIQIKGLPGAFDVPASARAKLMASRPYADGKVYLQNASSQIPPLLLGVRPGERVLDLCAAPGSKTGQLAALMQNEGEIFAVEKVRDRFYKLKANVYAQGATNVVPWLGSGTTVPHREPETFDRVMLDAPCSTEGRFRSHEPETTRYWSPRKIKEMRSKQSKLLYAAVQSLKPGGRLVYSTCTFAPEENEGVITKALKTFGSRLEVVAADLPFTGPLAKRIVPGLTSWGDKDFNPQVSLTTRVLPDDRFEGFYVAVLHKHESTLKSKA